MKAFDKVEGIAAPLRLANIDTDKIVPGRFLKTISRAGLASALFADMREDEGFILNRTPWRGAQILIALENFGCGSSREHAPWALAEYGLRCVIAPSFADIFHTNCFRNGLLPVILPKHRVEALLDVVSCAETSEIEVDLLEQTVRTASNSIYHFQIDPARKKDLLEGCDEIDGVMALQEDIASFERRRERAVCVPRNASF
jgi:3-isopropylmalate/(R)-2-methylmalate dehydratase small subunit